ncbi:hypothetical protein CFBP6411_04673 [Pseudomonas syringae group genomosp. 3]|uniref:Carbon storage regulator n=1 Tax=Pseudomonas syringae group genomosp. 3 TaxID=251701 RepID=A0A2K4WJG5_9PSED|nr:carbon storage regulator [Pseudomonas syringae group genomosp. 3]SOS36030.1 hypothetical protein CFBP6411_04673 [Pseudomonas syringae group genomosp. 3]
MLCLSRRVGESIVIGDNIKITVISGRDGKIRLGIRLDDAVRRGTPYVGRKADGSQ